MARRCGCGQRGPYAPTRLSSLPRAKASVSDLVNGDSKPLIFGNEPGKQTMRQVVCPRRKFSCFCPCHQRTIKETSRIFLSIIHLIYAHSSSRPAHFYSLFQIGDTSAFALRASGSISASCIVHRALVFFF